MATRIAEFDHWEAGYGGATVKVWLAGTSTLASIYTDEALSAAAANPQTLDSMTIGDVTYGKFTAPLYIGADYRLNVNTTETGANVRLPITTLAAADASTATVQSAAGTTDIELEDIVARSVYVRDHGVFLPTSDGAASAATNTTTLNAAASAASTQGGGCVVLPAGTFAHNALTALATNVVVRGQGINATVLQCAAGSNVHTQGGAFSGFIDLTLDGVSKTASSVGVYSKAKDKTVFENVLIKRFVTGISYLGGSGVNWKNLYIDACTNGAFLRGDNNASGGADGAEFWRNKWSGGQVTNCTSIGVELAYIDKKCYHNVLDHVGFVSNTGVALSVVGARYTDLTSGCWFTGNTTDLSIEDGADTADFLENTVVGFTMYGGLISSDMSFTDTCQDVVFRGVEFSGGTYTLTSVDNAIVSVDCIEDSDVVLAGGSSLMWMRQRTIVDDQPSTSGTTSDATSTEAWRYELAPGERVIVEAKIIANGRNVNDYATYHIERAAHRPGSTLDFDNQTANFTLGDTLTGTTSGATGLIIAQSDAGATGTLTLREVVGEFQNNETITDGAGGSALANGTMAHQSAVLLDVGDTALKTASETDGAFAAIFGVTGGAVRIMVAGAAAKTVEWTVSANVVSG